MICPKCGGEVYIYDRYRTTLKDMPIWTDRRTEIEAEIHRYRCVECGETFTEEIPFRYPKTRITMRAAEWIESLLSHGMSISSVHEITGVHWETIRKIHQNIMETALSKRKDELKSQEYKPKHLAVDEFAIHKGHTYATCVMDLDLGDVLWVGHGRAKKDFELFFQETNMDYLSEVEAVAMDMNASYNQLVTKHMPWAKIVYDRYHVQAQFGKDVLGAVRLNEARNHLNKANDILSSISENTDKDERKNIWAEVKKEKHQYAELKSSRWLILRKNDSLSDDRTEKLNRILKDHTDLAVCYAMKEEMSAIFDLRDEKEARIRWTNWFEASKTSGIEPLVKFAMLKEKRLEGLVAHASHPISTGKLEGFNNKIKVCKRIGYGYRNDDYFFTLIRFVSIPAGKF